MWKVTMSIGKDYESHKIRPETRLLRFNTQPDVFLAVWLLVGYLIAVHPKLTTKASTSRWESEIAMSKSWNVRISSEVAIMTAQFLGGIYIYFKVLWREMNLQLVADTMPDNWISLTYRPLPFKLKWRPQEPFGTSTQAAISHGWASEGLCEPFI